MSDEKKTNGKEAKPAGIKPAGVVSIILITIFLVFLGIVCFYSLLKFWPSIPEGKQTVSSSVNFISWTFSLSGEMRLIFIVIISGALGGLVHALRSLYWYIGNREMKRSWLVKYILLPFVGSILALIFYFVIRSGFFSPGTTIEKTSIFGFAAMAALVGMFSEQAALKLKEVADTLLFKPKPGKDSVPQEKENKGNK